MVEAKDTRKGMYVEINDIVFMITRKETVICGTHSHSKTKIFMKPLLGGGERNFVFAHHDSIKEADIVRGIGQVISKSESTVQIMDIESYETFDATISAEINEKIKEGDEVFYINFNGAVTVLKPVKE